MSKKQDQKRKAQLSAKAMKESFRFQMIFSKKTSMPNLAKNNSLLNAELGIICSNNLSQAILALHYIIESAENLLTNTGNMKLPVLVQLFCNNEVRNNVVEWVKTHYEGVTTHLSVYTNPQITEYGDIVPSCSQKLYLWHETKF